MELDWDKGGGLLPAIVQDAGSGAVLMLAYMNREALRASLTRDNGGAAAIVFLGMRFLKKRVEPLAKELDGLLLAVTALALAPGGSVPTADLNEALAALAVGVPPDIIHVVPEMKLSASYRPLLGPLKAAGIPKPSRYAWYLDEDTNRYKRLTAAVRAELVGAAGDD